MINDSKILDDALEITCTFDASVEEVYRAWTEAEQMLQWMGPGEVICESIEVDLKIGGKYRIHMKSTEGDHIAYGEFMEIEPNAKLVMSWQWEGGTFEGSVLTLLFSATASGSALNLSHALFPNRQQAEAHNEGWCGSLEKFDNYCTRLGEPA